MRVVTFWGPPIDGNYNFLFLLINTAGFGFRYWGLGLIVSLSIVTTLSYEIIASPQ